MKDYIVGKVEEFPEGGSVAVQAGTKTVAVFKVEGEFFAIHNRCTHKGASLCDGLLDKENKVIRCPWHLWDWSLEDGKLQAYTRKRMPVMNVRVEDGDIILRV